MCTKKYNCFCQARGPIIGDGSNKGQPLCARGYTFVDASVTH